MSESTGDSGGAGFWGLWDKVKETSTQVINVYKEDLQEFTSALTSDTKQVIAQSAEIIKKTADDITTDDLAEADEEEADSTAPSGISILTNKLKVGLDSFLSEYPTAEQKQLPAEDMVFLQDPDDKEAYQEWLTSFDLQKYTDEVSQLLTSDDHIRQAHAQYVPSVVGYGLFWKRYFYQQHKIEEVESRRAKLLERASAAIEEEEDLGWGDDDDSEGEQQVIDDDESEGGEQVIDDVALEPTPVCEESDGHLEVAQDCTETTPVTEPVEQVETREAVDTHQFESEAEEDVEECISRDANVLVNDPPTATGDLLDFSGATVVESPKPLLVASPEIVSMLRPTSPLERSPTVVFEDMSGSGGSPNSLIGDDWEVVPDKQVAALDDDLDDAWADWE